MDFWHLFNIRFTHVKKYILTAFLFVEIVYGNSRSLLDENESEYAPVVSKFDYFTFEKLVEVFVL